MTPTRKILRSRSVAALGAAALFVLPSTAVAQTADPGAPSPGTPTSNQYEIPVQAGRHDAAPPRAQRHSGGGSLYRSDNNFGTSSVVPGDPGGGNGGPSGGAPAGGGGGVAPAAAGGAGGAGAAGAAGAAVANTQERLDTGSPSASAAYTTLPLIIALGVVIGIAGVMMRRRAEI